MSTALTANAQRKFAFLIFHVMKIGSPLIQYVLIIFSMPSTAASSSPPPPLFGFTPFLAPTRKEKAFK